MSSISWSELFPTKFSAVIFVSYMALFINQGLIVTASQDSDSSYGYNTVTVVLMTEIVKLMVSICLYCKNHSVSSLLTEVRNSRVLRLYFVPAFLYCLYNNLAFVNLSAFDPTTYYLLLQFRVVVTGIVFQLLFKKILSAKQWLSLVLLTIGCMIKQYDISSPATAGSITKAEVPNPQSWNFNISINAVLILVQIVCSCCAGVYNEYLLKGDAASVNIYVQNVFMYVDSIVCNLGVLLAQGSFVAAFSRESLSSVLAPKVLVIVLNNAAIGIVTSFFLKTLNSILKTFASALELFFTAILCWLLFGIPIFVNTVVAISIVSYAVVLYSQNPVVNQPKASREETEALVEPESV
ncbi:UDP-galactose transporter senju [Bacillus rossius redtenbacheri]|uniref:UDP-galactose transporter senju n=1 Tax=Bacillus rossius redtenbacheri TaxID=93214 RepID=UPI002FDCD5A8